MSGQSAVSVSGLADLPLPAGERLECGDAIRCQCPFYEVCAAVRHPFAEVDVLTIEVLDMVCGGSGVAFAGGVLVGGLQVALKVSL